jgi:hypothetical protein
MAMSNARPPSHRHALALRLKAQLDQLHREAEAGGLTMVAHLAGAAAEAAQDAIECQPKPLLRLVKTR